MRRLPPNLSQHCIALTSTSSTVIGSTSCKWYIFFQAAFFRCPFSRSLSSPRQGLAIYSYKALLDAFWCSNGAPRLVVLRLHHRRLRRLRLRQRHRRDPACHHLPCLTWAGQRWRWPTNTCKCLCVEPRGVWTFWNFAPKDAETCWKTLFSPK